MEILTINDSTINTGILLGILLALFGLSSIVVTEKILGNKRKKKLNANKYEELYELGFILIKNLYYEGVYREFLIRINPTTSNNKKKGAATYDVIQAYYQPKPKDVNCAKNVEPINSYLGDLFFYNTTVIFIPRDFIKPNFKANFEGIVNMLKSEGYTPISKEGLMKLEEQELFDDETCIE